HCTPISERPCLCTKCYASLPTPGATLFPYTTLFRSIVAARVHLLHAHHRRLVRHAPRMHMEHRRDRHVDIVFVELALPRAAQHRSEEHTSELQSREKLVCRLLLEKKKNEMIAYQHKK